MSFNNFDDDLESTGSNRYKDYPEFESVSTSIDNQLHHINHTQIAAVKLALNGLETDHANAKLLESVTTSFNNITDSFKKLNLSIKALNDLIGEIEANHEDVEVLHYFRQKHAIQIKLMKDSLNNFKREQRRYDALKITSNQTDLHLGDHDSGNSGATSSQAQSQLQELVQITYEPINAEELEQQTLQIQEREREIHQIHQDTQEINEIFENLQSIVGEQQLLIDSIENNIFNYGAEVRNASSELRKAERYQRRSGGRMFCCLLILLGVVGFIVLVGVIF